MSNQSNFPKISELLNFHSATITNGGQKSNGGGWVSVTYVDHEVPLTGEWYWEYITDNYVYAFMGIGRLQYSSPHHHNTDFAFVQGGEYRYNGNNQANTSNIGTGDIVGVYVNNGITKVYVNNSLDHTYTQNLSVVGEPVYPAVFGSSNTTVNFGQDSSFLGVKTAQGNTDGNGIGDFYYTPPGNALALCSANSPISSDVDPAQTDDDYPGKQFGVLTYTGNSTTGQALTGLGFKPDLIWAKCSSHSQNNQLYDSSRMNSRGTPTPKGLRSDTNGAEFDDQSTGNNNPIISSFDTDGFTLGGSGSGPNDSGRTYVAWCWRANGGTTSSNSDGSITASVQANDKAGFSIITWTASGSNGSIGHGLSAKPDFHMIKKRNDSGSGWAVYHKSLGATKYLRLDTNGAPSTFQYTYNNTEPDATKIYLGDNGLTNHPSGDTYICYAWREIEGYSKFGKYIANQDANGTYVHLGFRPKLLAIRNTGNAGDGWRVYDSGREPNNVMNQSLSWHTTSAESTGTSNNIDFTSSGFKLRAANPTVNWGSPYGPYIYMAWGDVPFKYNNAF